MKKNILSIAGKPGLYALVSRGNRMLIVEALESGKRVPAYANDRITSLGDIAIYTEDEEVPLLEVLQAVKEKEGGKETAFNFRKASKEELFAYFEEVLPKFDQDRVHPSDIKKLLAWYNLLVKSGNTDFTDEEPETAATEAEAAVPKAAEEEAKAE